VSCFNHREGVEGLRTCALVQMGGFSTPENVLKGACHMMAMQLAAEPAVRQFVREQYFNYALVSTGTDISTRGVRVT
jgi:transcriptional accessory protein Tex/SPT6